MAGVGLEGHSAPGGGGKGADFPKVTLEVCGMSAAVLLFLILSFLSLYSLIPKNPCAVNTLGIKASVTAQLPGLCCQGAAPEASTAGTWSSRNCYFAFPQPVPAFQSARVDFP